jgi:hypothetical protein
MQKLGLIKQGMDKHRILNEIKRAAAANGGIPLGRSRFYQETGIKESDWSGKLWVRWSDAIKDAGFEPNSLQTAYNDEAIIEKFIGLVRELGHFPVNAQIRMKARNNDDFPSHNTIWRLGSRQQLIMKLLEYCKDRPEYEDITNICSPLITQSSKHNKSEPSTEELAGNPSTNTKEGYVYMALLKIGQEKRYKIGKAVLVERRTDQISLQLPEDLELIHTIKTDDAYGIEHYWHRRFAAENTKGEWFLLSKRDVEAFKKRKFM